MAVDGERQGRLDGDPDRRWARWPAPSCSARRRRAIRRTGRHQVYETALKSKAWTVQETPGPLPWASPDFLAEQRLILPDSVYRRLHLNEWCASEDRLTNLDDVRACVTLDGPLERQQGRQYVLALDLGVRNDRTVAAVMHSERMVEPGGRDVVQRMVLDRMEVWAGTRANPVDLGAVEQWVEFTARAYRARVVVDPWQAIAMVQRLRSRGLQVEEFTFSQQSTGRLAVALHTTIRDHRLAIPDDEELIDELVNVRLRETSPNVYRLDHDPDRHDDRGDRAGHGHPAAGDYAPARWPRALHRPRRSGTRTSASPSPRPERTGCFPSHHPLDIGSLATSRCRRASLHSAKTTTPPAPAWLRVRSGGPPMPTRNFPTAWPA